MPKDKSIHKVLVIGSGPIVIGQAAEFDYAGAQACRILRGGGRQRRPGELQPCDDHDRQASGGRDLSGAADGGDRRAHYRQRSARTASSPGLAGRRASPLLCSSATTASLEKYGVRLLGTDVDAIDKAEDRELFK